MAQQVNDETLRAEQLLDELLSLDLALNDPMNDGVVLHHLRHHPHGRHAAKDAGAQNQGDDGHGDGDGWMPRADLDSGTCAPSCRIRAVPGSV
jgi:hypothetical protein